MMARRQIKPGGRASRWPLWALLLSGFLYCSLLYYSLGPPRPKANSIVSASADAGVEEERVQNNEDCCRGREHVELLGPAVKWGSRMRFGSSQECCRACKATCREEVYLCNSWEFCGDRETCAHRFGECWLKKQKDVIFPNMQESGKNVIWTSGLIFGKGEGVVGMKTDHGTLHIKLLPDCAPHSVAYMVELLQSNHCDGCHFYRAEGRGHSWDSKGDHITYDSFGPPYALIQGTLEATGILFKEIPAEACPPLRRGSVAWVGPGPAFFISLANHDEWNGAFTVFGTVLAKDMEIAEKIASLPTKSDVWGNTTVSVLEKAINLRLRPITKFQ